MYKESCEWMCKKSSDKVQHPFVIKSKNQYYKSLTFQHVTSYVWYLHLPHSTKCWKTEAISSNIRNSTRVSTLIVLIQCSISFRSIRQEKEIKDIQIRKDEIKLPQCADMILHGNILADVVGHTCDPSIWKANTPQPRKHSDF